MDETCEHERDEGCLQSFLGKSEGKISLEIARRKWKDNIKMNLKEIVWGSGFGFISLRIKTSDVSL
jgi:hypothetical protein